MSIGINLADLGIDATAAAQPSPAAPKRKTAKPPARQFSPFDNVRKTQLVEGSVLAKTLYNVWTGAPVTIVNSPPGAGKTTLIVDIIAQLSDRGREMTVSVMTPTRRGTIDVSNRVQDRLVEMNSQVLVDLSMTVKKGDEELLLGENMAASKAKVSASMQAVKKAAEKGEALAQDDIAALSGPVIATAAAMAQRAGNITEESLYSFYEETEVTDRHVHHHKYSPICDVMIIDEAYQMTFADVLNAASFARQFVFVGDPGQIGPVITSNMSAYDGSTRQPHARAPEVFATYEDAEVMALPYSYRLGAITSAAIAPLYAFPFESRRPDRSLTTASGVACAEIESIMVPASDTPADIPTLRLVANRALSFIGSIVTETVDGVDGLHEVRPRDVAIVVSHNSQKVALETLLQGTVGAAITVGTADSLQGGQWHAVVALDSLFGRDTAGEHQLSLGRLCVMASRHMTHFTWVFSEDWASVLDTVDEEAPEAILGRKVRRALITSGATR